jgi:hypothetical protein
VIGQQDLLASLARLTGQTLPGDAAPDSVDVLDALLGSSRKGRVSIVEHARALSYREGDWKMIEGNDGPAMNRGTNTELGNAPGAQLFHVLKDAGERVDLASRYPERVRLMQAALEKIRAGR